MPVVDVHAHVVPKFVLESAVSPDPVLGLRLRDGRLVHPQGFDYPVPDEFHAAGAIVDALDARRIDRCVISIAPTLFAYHLPAAEGAAFAAGVNDSIAALAHRSQRLDGLASLPLQAPDLAAAELERAVATLGLRGALVGTTVGPDLPLDAREMRPVLETAERLGVPIMLHPHDGDAWPRLDDFYLDNVVGNPLSTTIAATRLILTGTLDRFPKLSLVLAHAGGYLPYQLGRLDHAHVVRAETRAQLDRRPSDYLRRFWFDTITHADRPLEFLADMVGIDRLVLGTDRPFDMADDAPVARLERVGVDPDEVGDTAAALFALAGEPHLAPETT